MTSVDEIDVAILAFVSDHKKSSVTDGAKALYKPSDVYELQKKDAMLRHRYKALVDRGLLIPKDDGRRTLYSVDKKRIKFGIGLHEKLGIRLDSRLEDDYCILIILENGIVIHSLDALEDKWGV